MGSRTEAWWASRLVIAALRAENAELRRVLELKMAKTLSFGYDGDRIQVSHGSLTDRGVIASWRQCCGARAMPVAPSSPVPKTAVR